MKKYKLEKLYPGSLEIGTEVKWGNHGLTGECYEARVKAGIFRFSKETIENNPEFWQEVEEPEYEIQSFNDTVTPGVSYSRHSSGRFGKSGAFTEEECISVYKNQIHSVKRLSDGLILTVGDIVLTKNTLCTDTITGFKLNDEKSSFKKGIWVTVKNGGMHIARIDRVIKPLFKTVDGKDIFEGDTYWCVNTAPHLWSTFEQTAKERTQLSKTVLAFSTQEKANTYQLDNAPRLSITDCLDVLNVWFTSSLGFEESVREYLRKSNK